MKKLDRICLQVAVAVPFLYVATLVLSAHFYPGYSHVRQAASELGMADALRPEIFNTGFVLIGAAIALTPANDGLAQRVCALDVFP
jgi:hypothetical membrane protein